ncbi:MAG: ABC transporter ATP-binding protein [Anaerolineae bacterium]|nr:ABC transporter ATP-binding protein [Anaerolineae bacterium]
MSEPFIRIENLVKIYKTPAGEFPALKGVSLTIDKGEFVAITGKSGSGKSTLLNTFTGIDHPTSGEVYIGSEALHRYSEQQMAIWRGRNLGIIFQFFQLLPTLNVIENVLIAMDLNNVIKAGQRRKRAMHLLELVGLGDKAFKMPSEVSGGEQQRVAIARSLANDPPLIVADEPTGNLDSATAESIFGLFKSLVSEGKTFIMVTHDNDLARRIDRNIIISDGKIISHGVGVGSNGAHPPTVVHPDNGVVAVPTPLTN